MSEALPRSGAAVLGSPIAHSLSPVLHQAAYDALGLTDWTYRAVECVAADLEPTLRALDAEGLAGASLTMPLKRAVMPMLAGVDESAVSVGAANTVIFGDGHDVRRWRGANTDVPGMMAVLHAAALEGGNAGVPWVLGSGATAGSALAALAAIGFRAAVVVARRPESAAELGSVAERLGVALGVRPWTEIGEVADAPVVVSTTPPGATDDLAAGLTAASGLLFDIVYSPWPTAMASAWQRAGGRVVGGMELLVEQAVEQVRLMTGQTPPADVMREAGYAALRSQ
jgi:shikimate dehydrogenase